ncbi:methylated-DNA--[protein]-cysteine S-methyltransferase [Candidatus Saccharibacteria bacterium]|nr:methylated-DNA--[protein]-cysteine S-methyltransferase [Candidatus Saccharibacteria bacterium]
MREYVELVPEAVQAEVLEYLDGERKEFSKAIQGLAMSQKGTDFQRAVWREIAAIPYGQTATYKDLAARIGRPNAVRAVGTACGKNAYPIVVPCHRVVASGGGLGGYAFGLEMKRRLLKLEGRQDISG